MQYAALLLVGGCGFTIPLGGAADDMPGTDGPEPTCAPQCPLGCDSTGTQCAELVPSNGIDPAWLGESTVVFAPITNGTIDTDSGMITGLTGFAFHALSAVDCGGGAMIGIGVFAFGSVEIPAGVRMRVVGARSLAIVAAGPIHIDGLLDASSGLECGTNAPRCAGAGGFIGANYDAFAPERGSGPAGGGPGYSNNGTGDESGGGGGGACAAGGNGGDAGGSYVGGAGGGMAMSATLVPLCGGSGGGAGGPASYVSDPGARGGGGGGAIQIVSGTEVLVLGGITVAGAGGQGDKAQTIDDGAGGGGAGGAILIESPVIEIASGAVLLANGGGGGGGYNNTLVATDGGESTILSTGAAAGGPGVRRGGNGGAGAMPAGEPAPGPVGDGGAGGGGATGRIRLNTRSASASILGVVSPAVGTCTTQGAVTTR